jgi:hypothetical protein
MKPLTKKQSQSFHKNCTALLKELGAIENKETQRSYNLVMETKTGPLHIRVDDDNKHCYSVFANFIGNEAAAQLKFGHWKKNIHESAESTENEVLQIVKDFYTNLKNA